MAKMKSIELARQAEDNAMEYIRTNLQACLLANGLSQQFAYYVAHSVTCDVWFRDYSIYDDGSFETLPSIKDRLADYKSEIQYAVRNHPNTLAIPKIEFDIRKKYKRQK